jgi:hypothetical protein
VVSLPCAHPPNAVTLQNHKSVFTEYMYMPFCDSQNKNNDFAKDHLPNFSFNGDALISTKYPLMFMLFS